MIHFSKFTVHWKSTKCTIYSSPLRIYITHIAKFYIQITRCHHHSLHIILKCRTKYIFSVLNAIDNPMHELCGKYQCLPSISFVTWLVLRAIVQNGALVARQISPVPNGRFPKSWREPNLGPFGNDISVNSTSDDQWAPRWSRIRWGLRCSANARVLCGPQNMSTYSIKSNNFFLHTHGTRIYRSLYYFFTAG